MGLLVDFLASAALDNVFTEEHTSEQLLEKLSARPDCTPAVGLFLRHTSMTKLLNLTVTDLLAGRRSAEKMAAYGVNYYQQKYMDRPLFERVSTVVCEAQAWDDMSERADAVVADVKQGQGRYYREALLAGAAIGDAIIG